MKALGFFFFFVFITAGLCAQEYLVFWCIVLPELSARRVTDNKTDP